MKTFSRWLWRDGRAPSDTIAHLTGYNVETERRRERQVLSTDDFLRLVEAAEAGPVVETIPGPDRPMMYILAAWTGCRRREISSLALRSFDSETDPVTATIEASYAENRRRDTQPLHQAVLQCLLVWLQSKEGVGRRYSVVSPPHSWWKLA